MVGTASQPTIAARDQQPFTPGVLPRGRVSAVSSDPCVDAGCVDEHVSEPFGGLLPILTADWLFEAPAEQEQGQGHNFVDAEPLPEEPRLPCLAARGKKPGLTRQDRLNIEALDNVTGCDATAPSPAPVLREREHEADEEELEFRRGRLLALTTVNFDTSCIVCDTAIGACRIADAMLGAILEASTESMYSISVVGDAFI